MSDHLVWPEGPPCDPACPGEWSQYHDGYSWGYEKGTAALDGLTAVHEVKMHRYDAALERERRLREALTDFLLWWDMPPFLTDDARLSEEVAALRAALAETPEAGS